MSTPRRSVLSALATLFFSRPARSEAQPGASSIIDDLSREPPIASIGTDWHLFTDTVMGGVSKAIMTRELVRGRRAIRLRGDVSLENNGGFVQISLDFRPDGGPIDASEWTGIEVDVLGNSEEYAVNLRTTDLTRPWQSYRQTFRATPNWATVKLPFGNFFANRTDIPLDTHRLRRLGIIGIGRDFYADISIGGVRYFR
ncbi:CIA30 family protein [Methylocystis echinoides]|uniref:CIA30 family protein n=1 Tax=Methylocystis echinoides TaxID=29468 RepID=UPI002492BEE6|nr:CIA30 family protein [Methylocystis echinoides]